MKRIVQFSLDHPLLVNLLTVFVFVAGVWAFTNLNREAFPNVSYDRVLIRADYTGSDPKSVEKLITIPIEREIKEISDIQEMRSISLQGMSILVIELEEYVKNKDRLINDIQRAVDRVEDLPLDMEDPPRVTEIRSKDQPIIEVSLTGELSEFALVDHAFNLERILLDLPQTAAIARKGWREKEIWVEADPQALADYSFSLQDLLDALARHNVNIPGGEIKEGATEYLLRTSGEFEKADEVARVVLRANDANHWVQVQDIAKVRESFEEESTLSRTNGKRAINLIVIKKENADAIDLVDQVRSAVDRYQEGAADGLKVSLVNDFSFYIRRRLNVLYANGAMGFVLVTLCLILFLNWRMALATALGVPFALLTTFFVMQISGITLNLLTMFGLITVLGMLVDDALVISENISRHHENGVPLKEACLRGVSEVWRPVTSSVLTTMVAFLPLMFMTGIIGKFVWFIPLMVIIALLASLFEVFWILPSHLAEWLKESGVKNHKIRDGFQRFGQKYVTGLGYFLKHRYRVALGFGLFFIFGIWIYQHIPFVLFPRRGVEVFFVRAKAPVGTPLEETARRFEPLEKLIGSLPKEEVDDFVLQAGIQQNDPHDPFTERFSHLGQIQVFLTPPADRDRDADEIVEDLRERAKGIEGFELVEFETMRPGPPVGKPVAIRVRGENLDLLRQIAQAVAYELQQIEGAKDVKIDEEPGKKELLLKVDPVKAALAGLGLREIGLALRASFDGLIATVIKKTDEEINVRVRFPKASQYSRTSLSQVMIPNARGDLIPLSQIAVFQEGEGVNAIRHFERERTLTVLANVDETRTNTLTVHQAMETP
ncbi:MAG: efflux RND transporter permease subunit, partial [Deltaproteobacteria bacterium]|nr:efflux RND transporter permease subunit [Deltaproteobacteria bacterium]